MLTTHPSSAVKRPPSRSKVARAKRTREALPQGMSRNYLFRVWLMARRHYPDAQVQLYRILVANPKLQKTLREFAAEHEIISAAKYGKFKAAAPKPEQTAWERMSSRGALWTSIVSGGLPSLAKRR